MEAHEELLEWAESIDIDLHGIRPLRLSGRGFGIVATKPLKAGKIILQVPTTALRTVDSVPRTICNKLPKDMSVHGLLAAMLALDKTAKYAKWNAVVPTRADMQSMPITWPEELRGCLPTAARNLLAKQEAKFKRDWGVVSAAFPPLGHDDYLYAWLLVNTRTFYHTTPRTLKLLHKDDHMALQPVADLFNHADEGCHVSFDDDGFTITTGRDYDKGEEILICYGAHSNDFLLAEYGFVLPSNRWDEVCLDDVVIPALTARQRDMLADAAFLGNYVLDAETVCHRTQVALRIMCVPLRDWHAFVDGVDDGETSQPRVDRLLVKLLEGYAQTVGKTLRAVSTMEKTAEEVARGELLRTRWVQIQGLIASTIQRLET